MNATLTLSLLTFDVVLTLAAVTPDVGAVVTRDVEAAVTPDVEAAVTPDVEAAVTPDGGAAVTGFSAVCTGCFDD